MILRCLISSRYIEPLTLSGVLACGYVKWKVNGGTKEKKRVEGSKERFHDVVKGTLQVTKDKISSSLCCLCGCFGNEPN